MKQRMRKLYQNGKLDVLATVIENSFKLGDPERDRDLWALASFFRAGLHGKDGKKNECSEWIEKAIGYGFLSADGFEGLTLIPDSFKVTEQFKNRMAKLRTDAEELVRIDFEKDVRAGIGNPKAPPFALPPEGGIGPNPLTAETLRGKPACLIVTPIFHDGFTKEAAALERLAAVFKDKVEVAVLFYQYDPADPSRRELTTNPKNGYLTSLGWKKPVPTGIVGRDYVRSLEIPYFPAHFFVTPKGGLGYRKDGYVEEKELEFIFGELAKLPRETAAAAPPPPAPEEKKDAPEAAPSPAPASAAPPAPAPPPSGKKEEPKPAPAVEPAK